MKKMPSEQDELLPEYEFDYSKAKPNRFAEDNQKRTFVVLDEDVSQIFTTSESVNKALRAIIDAFPSGIDNVTS